MYNFRENHEEFIKNNKLILKSQKRFTSKKVFTDKVTMIALSANDDKRMQSIDPIESYTHGTNKDLVREKLEIKCNNITKRCKK